MYLLQTQQRPFTQIFEKVLGRCHDVTVEDDDGFTRRVPSSFVVISESGQC
jgi:hypothetical protein